MNDTYTIIARYIQHTWKWCSDIQCKVGFPLGQFDLINQKKILASEKCCSEKNASTSVYHLLVSCFCLLGTSRSKERYWSCLRYEDSKKSRHVGKGTGAVIQ